jgi:hypothetical protein
MVQQAACSKDFVQIQHIHSINGSSSSTNQTPKARFAAAMMEVLLAGATAAQGSGIQCFRIASSSSRGGACCLRAQHRKTTALQACKQVQGQQGSVQAHHVNHPRQKRP